MSRSEGDEVWQVRLVGPRLPWQSGNIRPAELGEALCEALLARENLLEDADYLKIVPNRYIVEVNDKNYQRNYQPIEARLLEQWRVKMLDRLTTTNSRQGRQEYQLGGGLSLEIRPVADLAESQARILSQVQTGAAAGPAAGSRSPGSLELLTGGGRWPLRPGVLTIGRDKRCDIYLDARVIQEKRLVSGVHAHLLCEGEEVYLFDGAPGGGPSKNGTYLNNRRVPYGGQRLRDGDVIVLAALNPADPRPDTPGVAALRYRLERP